MIEDVIIDMLPESVRERARQEIERHFADTRHPPYDFVISGIDIEVSDYGTTYTIRLDVSGKPSYLNHISGSEPFVPTIWRSEERVVFKVGWNEQRA